MLSSFWLCGSEGFLPMPPSWPELSKYLSRCFSTAQNSFWTRQFWCLLVLLPFFISPLPHQQNVSFGGLFSSKETKKSHLREDRGSRESGAQTGVMPFLVKNCSTLNGMWAGALINHPSWNGQMCWKRLQKRIHWSQTQSLTPPAGALIQMGSYTTHLVGEPVLQGARPPEENSIFFWGPFIRCFYGFPPQLTSTHDLIGVITWE